MDLNFTLVGNKNLSSYDIFYHLNYNNDSVFNMGFTL